MPAWLHVLADACRLLVAISVLARTNPPGPPQMWVVCHAWVVCVVAENGASDTSKVFAIKRNLQNTLQLHGCVRVNASLVQDNDTLEKLREHHEKLNEMLQFCDAFCHEEDGCVGLPSLLLRHSNDGVSQ